MNRNQRKYGRSPARATMTLESQVKSELSRSRKNEIEEVLPPRSRSHAKQGKSMTNRCCFVVPDQKDFTAQQEQQQQDQYKQLILEQYGFDPILPDTINQLNELRKVLCGNGCKVENSSQYNPKEADIEVVSDESGWQAIDNADEIDKYIKRDKEKIESNTSLPQNVHISEVPRVKIIAEKYSKLKKHNMEVRQLDEKVVCIEYDIYKGNNTVKPKQRLRAFFSVKPTVKVDNTTFIEKELPMLKDRFDISDEDSSKLNRQEIEIIDSKIQENKPYLDDLRHVLKRNQAIYTKKNKTTLDLLSLYEMAKKQSPPLDEDFSHTNLLSRAELEEVKQLILKKCTSSLNGISRKKVKCNRERVDEGRKNEAISDTLVTVLMQE